MEAEKGVRAGGGEQLLFQEGGQEGLAEKVTFEKILEGNEGARHWVCGGKVFREQPVHPGVRV